MQEINSVLYDSISKAQNKGEPVARYIKAIIGQVCVSKINMFTGKPEEIILSGVPGEADIEDITVTLWTEMENEYFRRANKILLSGGYIAPYSEEIIEEVSVNEVDDEVLRDALEKPFFSIKALMDKFTSPVPIMRILRMAKEMNKSVGTITAIEKRLSALQAVDEPESQRIIEV